MNGVIAVLTFNEERDIERIIKEKDNLQNKVGKLEQQKFSNLNIQKQLKTKEETIKALTDNHRQLQTEKDNLLSLSGWLFLILAGLAIFLYYQHQSTPEEKAKQLLREEYEQK